METLLTPDKGLIIWTIVTFLVLVFVLGKIGWAPLLKALNDREEGIRRAIEEAETARKNSEQLKADYEKHLAEGQSQAQTILAQAQADAQKVKDGILKEAHEEAQKAIAQARRQMDDEKEKLIRDIRKEVSTLSVMAAEKLVRHSMNPKTQDELLNDFFKELDKQRN